MQKEIDTLKINDVEYVRKSDIQMQPADKVDGKTYCVIRTYSAGVHIGYIDTFEGQNAEVHKSRRLWRWDKANELCQVAMEGCSSDKFSMEVPVIHLADVIERIPCTEKAKKVLQEIPQWKA